MIISSISKGGERAGGDAGGIAKAGRGVATGEAEAATTLPAPSKGEQKLHSSIGDLTFMFQKGKFKEMNLAGVGEYQIKVMRTSPLWEVRWAFGNTTVPRILNIKGVGKCAENTRYQLGQFTELGIQGKPDLKFVWGMRSEIV
jgi:hypothetical protein